jgi:DNA-binding NarL/FixJ family response regulator
LLNLESSEEEPMGIGTAVEGRRWRDYGTDVLDLLASSDAPALATDHSNRVVFWNRAAERLLGKPAGQVLGRRCHEVMAGRDVFGNRLCHENCAVSVMTREGETVQGFEMVVSPAPKQEQAVNVTVLTIPGSRPDLFTVVHVLQKVDRTGRLARALERVAASRSGNGHGDGWQPVAAPETSTAKIPPLTEREREILRWVAVGLQNKEIAQKLDISLATVRNHIHNILEKLEIHSKLEAVSLAFRHGWVEPLKPEA